MTFADLQKANEQIKTTDIGKGKEYAEVNQRVKAFRMVFPNGTITTELLSLADGVAIFKATVLDGDGSTLATGHAYEKEGSSFINKTSFIENCETSAIGRALAMCGFGIDTSIASYEEVANAKMNQDAPKEEKKAEQPMTLLYIDAEMKVKILQQINRTGVTVQQICDLCKCDSIDNIPKSMFESLMKKLLKTPNKAGA